MGFLVKAVTGVFKAIGKVVTGVIGFATKALGSIFGFGVKKAKSTASSVNNLNKSLEPEAPRKIVFGKIAAPLDVRFWEVWGTNSNNFDEVLALATHRINAVYDFWAEEKLAISSAGVVQASFTGTLTRSVNLGTPGQAALSVGGGTLWTSASKFTGVAHMKLAWVVDEKKLPSGVPSRYTQVVEGALVYDPRRDSTRGGSGTHRAEDQTTWAYATLDGNGIPIGRNNALQALWYLLGWDVINPQTGEVMLVAGRGIDPEDINFASFIAGANACETAGYYTDMLLSTGDDHSANEDKITCQGLIGRLLDPGGLWSYYANVDDTASIAVDLTDDDVLFGSSVNWNEFKGMSDQFNQVGGKFINPSDTVLFQSFAYQTVRDATYEANLGVKKRRTQDFDQVLDNTLAQRLARLKLNQGQYQGEFKARFMMRAIRAQAWSVVRYTSERFGWTKYFRVWRHDINAFQGVGMTLREIHSSIWSAGTVLGAITQSAGANLDPLAQYAVLGLTAQQTTLASATTPIIRQDGMIISWTAPPTNIIQSELRYRLVGASNYQYHAAVLRGAATAVTIFPLVKGSAYEIQMRHISVYGVEGPWATIASFTAGVAGNIVTANAPVLGSIDPLTGRILDPTMYNTGNILSISNTSNISATYTVGASNVTVNIPAHNRTVASLTGPLVLNYAAGSFVVPFSTYWIAYIDDPELNGDAAPTYIYTNSPNDLLWPSRYFVSSGTTPASGGTGGTPPAGGGGGGFGETCVAADSFMPNGIKANQVNVGDSIEVLDYETMNGLSESTVEFIEVVNEVDCVKLVSESGIELVCSTSTPCTLINGLSVLAPDAKGYDLPVRDLDGFRWERIVDVIIVGKQSVAHIYCNKKCYGAGVKDGAYIYTHNLLMAKP